MEREIANAGTIEMISRIVEMMKVNATDWATVWITSACGFPTKSIPTGILSRSFNGRYAAAYDVLRIFTDPAYASPRTSTVCLILGVSSLIPTRRVAPSAERNVVADGRLPA